METSRRSFLQGMAGLGITLGLTDVACAFQANSGFLATARDTLSGAYLLICINDKLDIDWETNLPDRAHDVVVSPGAHQGVVIARRPGLFALVFDVNTGAILTTIKPQSGRHFYGHGVYAADGRTFYMSENAYETGTGVIGVYAADNDYRRVGEFSSGGIGPHEIALDANGQTLCVANGGIQTHPQTGRKKLNLDTMQSSFALIDVASGTLRDSFLLPENKSRYLSIRHMAQTRRGVVMACQDQRKTKTATTLVYRYDATLRDGLVPLEIGSADLENFQGYCGSVAYDPHRDCVAVSSPRGGLIGVWQASGRYQWLGRADLVDGCGVDARPDGQGFVVSSGGGVIEEISPRGDTGRKSSHPFRQWDNHLTTLFNS